MKASAFLGHAGLTLLYVQVTYGQANFLLRNLDSTGSAPVNAPVFDAVGVPLAGPNFSAELWGSATTDGLLPLVSLDRGESRLFTPFLTGGYFIATGDAFLSVLTVPPGGYAWLQVRAWDARLGATYEDVVASGLGGYGQSPLFYAKGGDPFDQFPIPGHLIGLQSFSLLPEVPEPSESALFVLLGLSLLWHIRRQRGDRAAVT